MQYGSLKGGMATFPRCAFIVSNLSETEFSPYLSELRTSGASSAQNLSASDLVIFRSLPPRKDRNTDELQQGKMSV